MKAPGRIEPMTMPPNQLSTKDLMDGIQFKLDFSLNDDDQAVQIFSGYSLQELIAEAERRAQQDPEVARVMASRFNLAVQRAKVIDISMAELISSTRERLISYRSLAA